MRSQPVKTALVTADPVVIVVMEELAVKMEKYEVLSVVMYMLNICDPPQDSEIFPWQLIGHAWLPT